MCGITGWVGPSLPEGGLTAANEAMAHRGPDDRGEWLSATGCAGLGQVRLSILDLSPQGHQPMPTPDGKAWIVFNGEIYNYKALRADLATRGHRFQTGTDTEVILACYREFGESMLERLNGVFALAIWDEAKGELLCARDPLGVKPFYWTRSQGRFLFASEIKAILTFPGVKAEADLESLATYLTYLWCPYPKSPFRGIEKLSPGHFMVLDGNGHQIRGGSFFDWHYEEDLGPDEAERVAGLRNALFESVDRQLASDVPVGMFLSGGLDSSAIALAFRTARPDERIQAFCSLTDEGDGFVPDWPYAQRIASQLNIELHPVPVEKMDLERWTRILGHLEEPQADPAIYHVDLIASMARERGLKVLLSGAGGDDLLTGYRRHLALSHEGLRLAIPTHIRKIASRIGAAMPGRPTLLRRIGKGLQGFDLSTDVRIATIFEWLPRNRVQDLLGTRSVHRDHRRMVERLGALPNATAPLNRMLFAETLGFLPDHNLNYTDKLTMAHGVEARVPLLDLELVRLANRLPVRDKLRGSTTKWILKKAMEGHLPKDLIHRPKTGFGAPLRDWIRGTMRETFRERLLDGQLRRRGWFQPAAVEQLWNDTQQGRVDGAYPLWAILTIDLWAERFGVT